MVNKKKNTPVPVAPVYVPNKLNDIDDRLREIAETYAGPEKMGELLQALKEVKKDIVAGIILEFCKGHDAVKKDLESKYL